MEVIEIVKRGGTLQACLGRTLHIRSSVFAGLIWPVRGGELTSNLWRIFGQGRVWMILRKGQAINCQYVMRVLSIEGGFWRKRTAPNIVRFRANLHAN